MSAVLIKYIIDSYNALAVKQPERLGCIILNKLCLLRLYRRGNPARKSRHAVILLSLCAPLLSGAHIFFIVGKKLLPCNGHFAYTYLDISPEAQGRAIYLLQLFHALLNQNTPVIV